MMAFARDCVCPRCGRIGLRNPGHAHAFGHYDYNRMYCPRLKSCGWKGTLADYDRDTEDKKRREAK